MLKRGIVLALLLAAASALVDAQSATRYRLRLFPRRAALQVPANQPPAVSILTPTAASTLLTTADSVAMTGTASSGASFGCAIASMTWSNDRGGSGVATINSACQWSIPINGTGDVVRFNDPFNADADESLAVHVPATGTSWTRVLTAGANTLTVLTGPKDLIPASEDTSGTALLGYTAASALTGTDYNVCVDLSAQAASGAASAFAGILFAYANTTNWSALAWRDAASNADLYLIQNVAGVRSTVASANVAPTTGQTMCVLERGSAASVTQNGTTVIPSTTASAFTAGNGVGVAWGALDQTSGRNIRQSQKLDNFQVTQIAAATGGIVLQNGVNVLTITATDTNAATATDTLTVTKGADTQAPSLTIDVPTNATAYVASSASIAFGGQCTDNDACLAPTWTCTTVCTPASGTATLTGTTWSVTGVTLSAGTGTFTVNASDAAANAATPKALSVTYQPADVTRPSCTITSPANLSSHTATPITVTATCSDNVAVASTRFTNAQSGAGFCTGVNAVTCLVPLALGSNVIDIFAMDAAGNENLANTARITVSYAPALAIDCASAPCALPAVVSNTAYPSGVSVTAFGGTPPYTFDNNSGGTSLAGYANCTGLSVSAAGVISGTPTTAGPVTCQPTIKVTDNVKATATSSFTIAIRAAGAEGGNDFFNELVAGTHGTVFQQVSYRTQALIDQYSEGTQNAVTYDATHDAAMLRIREFGVNPSTITLSAAIDATTRVIPLTTVNSGLTNGKPMLLGPYDAETHACTGPCELIIIGTNRTDGTPGTLNNVTRGTNGTTAQSWPAGTPIHFGSNRLGVSNQLRLKQLNSPVNTGDAEISWYFTVDIRWDDSWMNLSAPWGNQKLMQFTCDYTGTGNISRICIEPRVSYDTAAARALKAVGSVNLRAYNPNGGVEPWSATNGQVLCSEVGCSPRIIRAAANSGGGLGDESQTNTFFFYPFRWTRFHVNLISRANDYDRLTLWITDEQQAGVTALIFDNLPLSLTPTDVGNLANSITQWWVAEFDTSDDTLKRGDYRDWKAWIRNAVVLKNVSRAYIEANLRDRKPVP